MHDLAVVGAGPVGATLALALAGSARDIVVVDARAPGAEARGERSLAVSHGGRLILERIDAWRAVASTTDAITPIVAIDISQARGFGSATLSAADVNLPALGYVVSSAALQAALDAALARAGIAVRFGAQVTDVTPGEAHAVVRVQDDDTPIHARLAVVADGRGTTVPGIARVRHDYGQVALIADVMPAAPHAGIAFERFTSEGPVALLPKRDRYGLVWTQTPERAAATLALSDDEFLAALAQHAGRRMPVLRSVGERRTFPLTLEYARPVTVPRVVMLGNAAQTLHPVAGQGFNIGLRDAYELAQQLAAVRDADVGAPAVVAAFARGRRSDRLAGIALTHGLSRLFTNDAMLLRWPRGIALSLLDALPPARKAFTRAMLFGVR